MKDTTIKKLIDAETKRQKSVINLIASENYVSKDVLEALGSVFTNKYAEGYSKARYYGGNEVVDTLEDECKRRALHVFGLDTGAHKDTGATDAFKSKWHVNVQALSGSPANLAVYTALVPKGGKIMGMNLADGGHLTHGHKVSATGMFWQQVPFGVDPTTEKIDYEALKKLAMAEKPHIIVSGFTAYPRVVDWKKFRDIADACGALLMTDMSHVAGLVAGKAYPSPFEYADVVTTTVHKTLRGPRSALIFVRRDLYIDENGKRVKATDVEKLKKSSPLDTPLAAKKIKNGASLIDKAVFPGLQGGPHLNQIAAVAVALKEAAAPAFRAYAKQVMKNARVLANELAIYGWHIISLGTDSHLILVDTWMGGVKNTLGAGGVSGKEASDMLEKAGIIVNKNTIPGESRSAMDPSGIRLGSAAETTRGKKEKDFMRLAKKIDDVLKGKIKKSSIKNK